MRRPLVLLDLDNTLVDRRGTLADWANAFTVRHGLEDEEQAHVLGLVAERVGSDACGDSACFQTTCT
ncbi:hypothetical protein ACWD3I_45865 [Streptomyces sp. NPDC002817]|uniref:hypothetical protein n=1 Tax=Streptomyces sp. NPDC088357 TaxID=3154655 RepID=UPI00342B3BE0